MWYKTLIIGNGEIGSALKRVLDKRGKFKSSIIDIKDKNFKERVRNTNCRTLHICIPYSKSFIKDCLKYIKSFTPDLCIIHSTVSVGTTKKVQLKTLSKVYVTHSPVRGQHPNMSESLELFVKYVGTDNKKAYQLAKKEMSNIKTEWVKDSKTTELGKMLSTSYYGICISWHREMKRICNHFNVDPKDAVSSFNKTYNTGYTKLRPNVVRPVLSFPTGKIGGHCVAQNAKLLGKQLKSKFLELIK